MDDVLQAIRADLQGDRADIIAKNMTMSSEQAAKFWPVFEKYQSEQNVIMDDQLRGIQRYIENYDTIDDAGALALINAHFDRDARMNALRQKWFGEFQKGAGNEAGRAGDADRSAAVPRAADAVRVAYPAVALNKGACWRKCACSRVAYSRARIVTAWCYGAGMEQRQLGRSGPRVSAIGLGCMSLGIADIYTSSVHDDEAAVAVVRRALDRGMTFLDTADIYGDSS
jgi:hypothetical protein